MNFRRVRLPRTEPQLETAEPAATPQATSVSLLERAAAAAPLTGVAEDRRTDALARAEAFAEVFGAGGFVVVERAGWWSLTAPELEVLARRCGVAFCLQGGSSPADPPTFVIGGTLVQSLAELGALTRPMAVLADLRDSLTSTDVEVSPVQVSATSVTMRVNGATVSVSDEGLVSCVVTGRQVTAASAPKLKVGA